MPEPLPSVIKRDLDLVGLTQCGGISGVAFHLNGFPALFFNVAFIIQEQIISFHMSLYLLVYFVYWVSCGCFKGIVQCVVVLLDTFGRLIPYSSCQHTPSLGKQRLNQALL